MKSLQIDGCLVINLPCRTDRWEVFQKRLPLLESLGLKPIRMDAVSGRDVPGYGKKPWFRQRHSAKRDQAWAGKAGCTLSHRNAIALAKERAWKNVLILEDDVSFNAAILVQWKRLMESMSVLPNDWIALYLYGHHPVSPVRVVKSYPETTCYEIGGAIGAVAYIVNGRYYDELLRLLPTEPTVWTWIARHKTVDRWYSRQFVLLGHAYAMVPFGITHLATPSDATTAGEPYDASSFDGSHFTRPKNYLLQRLWLCFQNRLALDLSIVRQWMKRSRGL